MAELAASAFAAASAAAVSGTTAAATSAAAWAAGTTITTAAGATSSLLGSAALGGLSTALTVGSAVSTILGGALAYRQSQQQADVAELNARSAEIEASEKSLRIRREMVQKVGAARVAFAGSGTDISSASAIEAGYRAEADFETGLARAGGDIGAASARMQAGTLRTRGYASLVEAAGRAAGGLYQNQISIARRG